MKKSNKNLKEYLTGIIFFALVSCIHGCKNKSESNISIEQQVALDMITEYRIVKKSGKPVEVCVAAMSVVAAYLQAKDESKYQEWQSIKNQDCQLAGM